MPQHSIVFFFLGIPPYLAQKRRKTSSREASQQRPHPRLLFAERYCLRSAALPRTGSD